MSRGRRYNNEPKLNMKKVIAVIIAIAVIVMFVIAIKNLLNSDSSSSKLVSASYFLINKDFPVISAGCSFPIISIKVGMISAKHPPSLKV